MTGINWKSPGLFIIKCSLYEEVLMPAPHADENIFLGLFLKNAEVQFTWSTLVVRIKHLHFIGLENFTPRMLSKENSFLGGKINGRPEECCLG